MISLVVLLDSASIQKLQNLINKNKEDYTVISPAFQWAQGREDVEFKWLDSYLVENEYQVGS